MEARENSITPKQPAIGRGAGFARRVSGPVSGAIGRHETFPESGSTTGRRAEDLVIALVHKHAASVLAVARRYSLCADDAHDAYQRGMEILVKRAADLEPATAAAWLKTVVKHEALAIRGERKRSIATDDLDAAMVAPGSDPADRSERFARLAAAAEALEHLKPHEAKAIILKAQGLSYNEIASSQGWSYTKVNRLLSEGRSAMRERLESIESGKECQRMEPLIARHLDGESKFRECHSVKVHLKHCAPCRRRLVVERTSVEGVAALAPVGLLAVGCSTGSPWEAFTGWITDQAGGGAIRLQNAVELASGGKVAAVAATAAVVVGGGAVVHQGANDAESPSPRKSTPAGFVVPAVSAAAGGSQPQFAVSASHARTPAQRPRRGRRASSHVQPSGQEEFGPGAGSDSVPVAHAAGGGGNQTESVQLESGGAEPSSNPQSPSEQGEFTP